MPLTHQFFHQALAELLPKERFPLPDKTFLPSLVVGFSGGVDSTVLLHLCKWLRDRGYLQSLRAVHIHHGLSSLADDWGVHSEALCALWGIPLTVCKVSVCSRRSVEEGARNARYQVFENELAADEVLLQGHHQDDQVETVLYRIMRGTGVAGLKGIPAIRPLGKGWLVRPLLGFSREEIERYARGHQLSWIEDDSNADCRFDRNFLRNQVIPELSQRWPGMKAGVSRLSELSREADGIVREVALQDYQQCMQEKALPVLGVVKNLDIHSLQQLSPSRRSEVMREWLNREGLATPPQFTLQQIIDEVILAREDGVPVVRWDGGEVRRFKGALIAASPQGPQISYTKECFSGQSSILPDQTQLFCNEVAATSSQAKLGCCVVRPSVSGTLSTRDLVIVKAFSLPGRKGRKSLKKWLNELAVPPWLRGQLPILHDNEQLIAVPGVLVADGYQNEPGMPGLELIWRR